MYSSICLLGRLGSDPQLQFTEDGTALARFSLAVDCGFGESKHTTWFQVSVFGNQAEAVNTHLSKGSVCMVYSDDIRVSPYLSKREKEPRASLNLIARRVVFADSRQSEDSGDLEGIPF